MTPQVPEYVVTFEAAMRPLIAAIALGLIWIGATRMEGPAQSRYATAGALSVVLIAWLAVAQYLVGKHCKPRLRDTAPLDRGGPSLSHHGWNLPRPLGGRTPALAIRAASRDW
jgi:hypothetical protein